MSGQTIYVSHTLEDSAAAERLKGELTAAGFTIALNIHTIPPGRPKPAVQEAMKGAIRFLACFSSRYSAPTEYEEDELSWAIEEFAARPAGEWLIPVKLTACDIPALQTAAGDLSKLATMDLHEDWAAGVARLLASLPAAPVAVEAAKSSLPPSNPAPRLEVNGVTFTAGELEVTNVEGSGQAGDMVIGLKETAIVGKATFVNNKR